MTGSKHLNENVFVSNVLEKTRDVDPDSVGSASGLWIRICILNADPDPGV